MVVQDKREKESEIKGRRTTKTDQKDSCNCLHESFFARRNGEQKERFQAET
jgi:hypothetical protein